MESVIIAHDNKLSTEEVILGVWFSKSTLGLKGCYKYVNYHERDISADIFLVGNSFPSGELILLNKC